MKRFGLLLFVVLIFLSACASKPEATIAVIVTETVATDMPTLTSTPIPATETPVPPTLTATRTLTATETMTPTVVVLFDQIQILGGYYNEERSIIYLSFPEVDKNYTYKMDHSEYECKIDVEYEGRVNCYGHFLDNQRSKQALVQVFDPESAQLLFENYVSVPMTIPTPLPAGDASTWCPLRGQKISCETEWRSENNSTCVVMTCYDACGYYYSEHTCKEPWHNNAIIQPTPTPF